MRKPFLIAVPLQLLGGIHSVKETLCINEWTLALALFSAFFLGWVTVRIADRYFN
ncbi:MAG TPA: hypothetical protein VLJ37_10290 [bacterium]|nr:hypothetical protein [bacterium]